MADEERKLEPVEAEREAIQQEGSEEEEGEIKPSTSRPTVVLFKRTNYRFYTREELDSENSLINEGIDRMVIMELRSDIYRFLRKLGAALFNPFDQPPYTVAAAASLCHRVFRRRSMLSNDRYIIAAAAFFTAGKTTYVPRALSDVALASFRIRCEGHADLADHYNDARIRRDYEDALLSAESLILNTNAFGFQGVQEVEDVHTTMTALLNDELTSLHRGEGPWDDATRSKTIAAFDNLRETAKNLALDIFRSDVVLMFPGSQLALAILRVALRLLKEKKRLPPNYNFEGGPEGQSWFEKRGMGTELMEAILKEVYAFLNRKAPHPSKVPQVAPIPPDLLDLQAQQQEEMTEMEAKGMLANPYADLMPAAQEYMAYGGAVGGYQQPRPPAYPPPPGMGAPPQPPGAPLVPVPPSGAPPPMRSRFGAEISYDDL